MGLVWVNFFIFYFLFFIWLVVCGLWFVGYVIIGA